MATKREKKRKRRRGEKDLPSPPKDRMVRSPIRAK